MNSDRHPFHPWRPEEDAKLLRIIAAGKPRGEAAWQRVAEEFSRRTLSAVQQRALTLRDRENGITPKTRYRAKRAAIVAQRRMQDPIMPAALPQHASLTAAVFGDPLPGRSALDRRPADRELV